MTYVTSVTSFVLFHFILELLGIFMVMINIVKIEQINATKNYPPNMSVKNVCLPRNLCFTRPILIWSRPWR